MAYNPRASNTKPGIGPPIMQDSGGSKGSGDYH